MTEKLPSFIAALAVTVAVFAATAPASAKDRPITVTATEANVPVRFVSYRDLNLAEQADARILAKRVRQAAKEVCDESTPDGAFNESMFLSCRSIAWQGARPQMKRAIAQAQEIAANGFSAIAPVAITISLR